MKTVTLADLNELERGRKDDDTILYYYSSDDLFDAVVFPEDAYLKESSLPLVFKNQMPLFPKRMIVKLIEDMACGEPLDETKDWSGLSVKGTDTGFMSYSNSLELLRRVADKDLVNKYYDNYQRFSEEIAKAGAEDLQLLQHIMKASRIHEMILSSDGTIGCSPFNTADYYDRVMQEFTLCDDIPEARFLTVNTTLLPLWDIQKLVAERAHKSTNKNMAVQFTGVIMDKARKPYLVFYNRDDFDNWIRFHSNILKQIVKKVPPNVMGFDVELSLALQKITEGRRGYPDISSIGAIAIALSSNFVVFLNDKKFSNKVKLYGTIFNYIRAVLEIGE